MNVERSEIQAGIEHLRMVAERLQEMETEVQAELRYCMSDDSGLMQIDARLSHLSSAIRTVKEAAHGERIALESALAR